MCISTQQTQVLAYLLAHKTRRGRSVFRCADLFRLHRDVNWATVSVTLYHVKAF